LDNKYNKLMDHIEVTDEMRDRILLNISKADIKPRQAGVKAISGAKRAKISRIIGIAAAAGIVLSVGGIILFRMADSSHKSAEAPQYAANKNDSYSFAGAADYEAEGVDSLENDKLSGDSDSGARGALAAETVATQADGPEQADSEQQIMFINGVGKSKGSVTVSSITYINNGKKAVTNDSSRIAEVLRLISSLNMIPSADVEVKGFELILSGNGNDTHVIIGDGSVKVNDDIYRSSSADHKKIESDIIAMFEN